MEEGRKARERTTMGETCDSPDGAQTLKNWKRWTHQKSMVKDFMQKEVSTPKSGEQSNFLEEIAV